MDVPLRIAAFLSRWSEEVYKTEWGKKIPYHKILTLLPLFLLSYYREVIHMERNVAYLDHIPYRCQIKMGVFCLEAPRVLNQSRPIARHFVRLWKLPLVGIYVLSVCKVPHQVLLFHLYYSWFWLSSHRGGSWAWLARWVTSPISLADHTYLWLNGGNCLLSSEVDSKSMAIIDNNVTL